MLQRGRARAGAELNEDMGWNDSDVNRASTGPRPRGRGIRHYSRCCRQQGIASTGPRPRGRGIYGQFSVTNGALVGFNGAAPARARNFKHRDQLCSILALLQRGRARAGAELALLLLPLAQACNTSIATASTDSVALVLMFSNLLVIICLF